MNDTSCTYQEQLLPLGEARTMLVHKGDQSLALHSTHSSCHVSLNIRRMHHSPYAAQASDSALTNEVRTARVHDEPLSQRFTSDKLRATHSACPVCGSAGTVACKSCQGTGHLQRGGYNKRNPVDMTRVIGSRWTAMQQTLGWRHFRVTQVRKQGKNSFLLMQASCDHSAQLWVNVQLVKDRKQWAAGWLQMKEMQDPASLLSSGIQCGVCVGTGRRMCEACKGEGYSQLIEL